MELTKKLVKELHTELWLWLAKHPTLEKEDWPRWTINDGDLRGVSAHCFPCEYRMRNNPTGILCHCVLDFPGWKKAIRSDRECLGGLFDNWRFASGNERSALAKKIANLPIR